MDWLIDKLRNSRIAGAIGQVERGESVDVEKLIELQALDLVRAGQLLLADRIEDERAADDRAIAAARSR